jgi:hypothetical protein
MIARRSLPHFVAVALSSLQRSSRLSRPSPGSLARGVVLLASIAPITPIASIASLAALASATAGCDEPKKTPAAKPDGGQESSTPNADPRLVAAVAAASASAAAAKAKAGSRAGGRPETGVFPHGEADALMARGAQPKLEVGSDGNEPRMLLKSSAAAWKGKAQLSVSTRIGPRSALPSVDLLVSLGLEKPKDKKDGDKKDADRKDADKAAELPGILGEVLKAGPSAEQPGTLPPEVLKEIAKLKGSELHLVPSETFAAMSPSSRLSKDAKADLSRVLDEAAEGLFFLSVPLPTKPVGEGAVWIAGSRQSIGGVDVISYRLYRVKSASPTRVTLTLEAHQYAASESVEFPGLPKTATLAQFESTAQGELELTPGDGLAQAGHVTHSTTMTMRDGEGQAARNLSLQTVSEVKLARGAAEKP